MVYQSIKFTNNVWALAEIKITPGSPTITVSCYSVTNAAVMQAVTIYFSAPMCEVFWPPVV